MHKYRFINLLKKAVLAARERGITQPSGKGGVLCCSNVLSQLLAQPAL